MCTHRQRAVSAAVHAEATGNKRSPACLRPPPIPVRAARVTARPRPPSSSCRQMRCVERLRGADWSELGTQIQWQLLRPSTTVVSVSRKPASPSVKMSVLRVMSSTRAPVTTTAPPESRGQRGRQLAPSHCTHRGTSYLTCCVYSGQAPADVPG